MLAALSAASLHGAHGSIWSLSVEAGSSNNEIAARGPAFPTRHVDGRSASVFGVAQRRITTTVFVAGGAVVVTKALGKGIGMDSGNFHCLPTATSAFRHLVAASLSQSLPLMAPRNSSLVVRRGSPNACSESPSTHPCLCKRLRQNGRWLNH